MLLWKLFYQVSSIIDPDESYTILVLFLVCKTTVASIKCLGQPFFQPVYAKELLRICLKLTTEDRYTRT